MIKIHISPTGDENFKRFCCSVFKVESKFIYPRQGTKTQHDHPYSKRHTHQNSYIPDRGRKLISVSSNPEFERIKIHISPTGDENSVVIDQTLHALLSKFIYPRQGTKTQVTTPLNISLSYQNSYIPDRGRKQEGY